VIPNSLATNIFQLNGDKEARTPDPCNAIAVLYQLSYDPESILNLLDRVSACQASLDRVDYDLVIRADPSTREK
jgi:hypothetical protein